MVAHLLGQEERHPLQKVVLRADVRRENRLEHRLTPGELTNRVIVANGRHTPVTIEFRRYFRNCSGISGGRSSSAVPDAVFRPFDRFGNCDRSC